MVLSPAALVRQHPLGGPASRVWRAVPARGGAGPAVALKMVSDRLALHAEAAALARSRHPNVVRLLDVVEQSRGGALVLELADGSLAGHVAVTGPVAATEVAVVGAALADALAAVHGAGLVHGDIHPGNVLLSRGRPLLADFEPAFAGGWGAAGFTAPEVGAGQSAGTGADIWSLGAVCRWMLGGGTAGALDGVLAGAMAAQESARCSGAAAFAEALRGATAAAWSAPTGPAPSSPPPPLPVVPAVLSGPVVITRRFGPRPPGPPPAAKARRRRRSPAAGPGAR
ncbi:MAG: protein kinase domain-containing protein [Acidimicrobiia bacterium]